MRNEYRIVWETHWELDARMRLCSQQSQRDALRMLHTLRRHPELSDFELGEFIGRTTREIWQWWRIYDQAGLGSLLMSADGSPWLVISGAPAPRELGERSRFLGLSSGSGAEPRN